MLPGALADRTSVDPPKRFWPPIISRGRDPVEGIAVALIMVSSSASSEKVIDAAVVAVSAIISYTFFSMLFSPKVLPEKDGLLVLAGLITAAIILWQGYLISSQSKLQTKQVQLQTLIELHKLWTSPRMLSLRSSWTEHDDGPKANEIVFDFLEDLASFRNMAIFDDELLWNHSLGWYATHYYFYGQKTIQYIQKNQLAGSDPSLYEHLHDLAEAYRRTEARERKCTIADVHSEYDRTRELLFREERALADHARLVRDG